MSLVTDALSKSRKSQLLAKANRRESYLNSKPTKVRPAVKTSSREKDPKDEHGPAEVMDPRPHISQPKEIAQKKGSANDGPACHVKLKRPARPTTARTNMPQTNLRRFVAVSDSGATLTFPLPQGVALEPQKKSVRRRKGRFDHFLIHLVAAGTFIATAMAVAFYAFTSPNRLEDRADLPVNASPDLDRSSVQMERRHDSPEPSAPMSLRQSIQRLDIRGIQIAPYAAKAIINDRIVHQGDRFACNNSTLIFKGIQDSSLIFQDEDGEIYTRPLRYHARSAQSGDAF